MRTWPAPADLLADGPMPLRVLLDQLGEDQKQDMAGPIARWFLTLPGVVVTGLNASGERIAIDSRALIDGGIGRHDGSIVGGQGRQRWTDVTIASASRRRGRKRTLCDAMIEYLRVHHPQGVPGDLKNAALLDDMRKAGVRGGGKTLSRAINEAYAAPKRRR